MNKKVFTGLVVLMGISILGIIAVQLVWLNNAVRIKNELFNRGVNEALHQTVNRLEKIHDFGVFNNMVFSDSVHWVHQIDEDVVIAPGGEAHFSPDEKIVLRDSTNRAPRPVKIIRELKPANGNAVIEIKVDADADQNNTVSSFSYRMSAGTNNKNHLLFSKKNSDESKIFIVNADTIENIDSLYAVETVKIDSFITKLDTFNIIKPEISKRLKVKAGRLKNIANQAINEIYMWDVKEIDEDLIQTVLGEELKNKNIPIDFEFGIVHDSILKFPMAVNDSAKVAASEFKVNLYPNNIFQKNIKLAVFFPEKGSFIYRSLNWLLLASFLFSLFILITFSLSIFYILRQKKISEMKSDFINNMTHEFKTPIATISVATDSITNEKVVHDPERIKYFAGMIKKENTRMNRQVEDILTIARLDKKDFEFNWETINVHDLINDAIQGIALQVEKRGGKINTFFKATNPMATTDKIHCTNVVYNLIDNANKYSISTPEITVVTKNSQHGVIISVKDKGIGMSKTIQHKIFERFFRQTTGNIHNVKGFGLGLSYVKAVLEANKGTITVQSEPGKGSKFEVYLPFVRN